MKKELLNKEDRFQEFHEKFLNLVSQGKELLEKIDSAKTLGEVKELEAAYNKVVDSHLSVSEEYEEMVFSKNRKDRGTHHTHEAIQISDLNNRFRSQRERFADKIEKFVIANKSVIE